MRPLRFAVVYLAYLAAFVAVVDYLVFWRPFVADLQRRSPEEQAIPRYVDGATMRRLGSLLADRTSSFPRFDREKAPGIVRLCALGDSFTYGDETADGDDYPAALQRVFAERGADNVEVVNFGNPWYGFHQAYVMWDDVARGFDCDFVLLGPDCFQPDRDTTFNHTNLAYPYYLHARYVLDGDDVRLEEVVGETPEERFDGYFGFIPRMPYLRYDRSAPAFLLAVLPHGRTLANPFYYDTDDAAVEAHATYERLLRKMVADGPPVLLLHSLAPIVELADGIGSDRLVAVLAPRNERYPYAAPGGHYSSFGNRWIAEQYFALLTGDDSGPMLLDFEDVESSGGKRAPATRQRPAEVSGFDAIVARVAGHPAGLLAVASSNPAERRGAPGDLAGSRALSLLAIEKPGTSVVDAAFVPVEALLSGDEPVVLRMERGSNSEDVVVGHLRLVDPRLSMATATIDGFDLAGDLLFGGNDLVGRERVRGAAVTILVGGTPALRSRADQASWPIRLAPVVGPLRTLRVGKSQHAPVAELPSKGLLTLRFTHGTEPAIEVPIAHWRKHPGRALASSRRLSERISVAGGHAVVSSRGADPARPR